jgi:hypothetical protein
MSDPRVKSVLFGTPDEAAAAWGALFAEALAPIKWVMTKTAHDYAAALVTQEAYRRHAAAMREAAEKQAAIAAEGRSGRLAAEGG